jgi:hypothetical protein
MMIHWVDKPAPTPVNPPVEMADEGFEGHQVKNSINEGASPERRVPVQCHETTEYEASNSDLGEHSSMRVHLCGMQSCDRLTLLRVEKHGEECGE